MENQIMQTPTHFRINYDQHTTTPETVIFKWDAIHAVQKQNQRGTYWIIIWFANNTMQFRADNTPDAVKLLELWNGLFEAQMEMLG